jgi:hypothetical protein
LLCSSILRNIGSYNREEVQFIINTFNLDNHNGPIILSSESISNKTFMNQEIVRRLKYFFPNAKIFFTIRNQFTAIESFYVNHGRILKNCPAPYNGKHVKFENWFNYSINNLDRSYLGLIKYEPLINLFLKYYSKDSIKIFLFEEFKNNLKLFSEKISDFLNLDEFIVYNLLNDKKKNPRDSSGVVYYKIFREFFFPGSKLSKFNIFGSNFIKLFHSKLNNSKPLIIDFTIDQKRIISEIYKDYNKKLSAEFNLDLKKWDYPL